MLIELYTIYILLETTTNKHYKRMSVIERKEADEVNASNEDNEEDVDGATYVSS